ncbi:MAG TPA: hypothetical protein VNO21_20965, partial [Polyangiaceae bacterium]|nr:hypothetical protein [Polyangiaceae bacterium]
RRPPPTTRPPPARAERPAGSTNGAPPGTRPPVGAEATDAEKRDEKKEKDPAPTPEAKPSSTSN